MQCSEFNKFILNALCVFMFLFAFNAPILADDINWNRVTANTLLAIDWMQTRDIIGDERYYETNSILGAYPDQNKVNKYFLTSVLLVNVIGESLDKKHSDYFYLAVSVIEASFVHGNYTIGVGLRF